MKGILITFEGVEGCGKTTQSRMFYDYLLKCGRPVIYTREPGGKRISERIRNLLLDREHGEMTPLTELFLYLASRTQHVTDLIGPALETGTTVVCDRFTDASLSYQGTGRKIDRALIRRLNDLATGEVKPNLTFVVDIDPVIGMKRKTCVETSGNTSRREEMDRIEMESIDFHRAVRDGYLLTAREEPERVVAVDGDRAREVVAGEIIDVYERRFGEWVGGKPEGA